MTHFLKLAALCAFFPTPAQAQNFTQTVRGTIVEQSLQTPLPGATVVLLDASPLKGALSDADGTFRMGQVPVGRRSFKITCLGYKEITLTNIAVDAGKELVLTVSLEESVTQLGEVTIRPTVEKDRPLNEMAVVSARTFSIDETQKFAAAINDPARMATAYAGVVGADDGSNILVIRGNTPTGLLWRMEGVEIPNPNHFANLGMAGGGISILSAQLLSNSDFMTGAFPAEYGNALSGVFDLRLRKGNNTKREHTVQVGLLGIDVSGEGPFSKNYQGSYLFNYRYSTLGLLSKLGVSIGSGVNIFQDLAFNVFLPTRNWGNFTIFGFGGLSSSETKAVNDSTQWTTSFDRYTDRFTANTGAAGVTHTLTLGTNASLKTVLLASGYRTTDRFSRLDDQYVPALRSQESYLTQKRTITTTLTYRVGSRFTLRTGLIGNALRYGLFRKEYQPEVNQFQIPIQTSDQTHSLQAFAQGNLRLSEQLTFNAGLHYLRLLLNGTDAIEPRGSVRWAFAPRQSISLGYGLHSQIQTIATYFSRATGAETGVALPNRNLKFTRSHHVVAGYDWSINDHLRIKTEAYYQALFNIPVSADQRDGFALINKYDALPTRRLTNRGTGRNYGLELTVEQFMHNNLYFLWSSSLYDSQYRGSDRVWRNTRYNGRHANSFLLGKEFVRGERGLFRRSTLGLNVKLTYYGGYRDSPIDVAKSRQQQETVYLNDQLFTKQTPAYFRTDVRLSWKKNRSHSTRTVSLDIQNVTNRSNVAGQFFDVESGLVKTAYLTGLIPVLSYRVAF